MPSKSDPGLPTRPPLPLPSLFRLSVIVAVLGFGIVPANANGASQAPGPGGVTAPEAFSPWKPWSSRGEAQAFHFLMATSGVRNHKGAEGVNSAYSAHESATQRVGIAVPILYLRTTYGSKRDWVFDPDFDTTRKCGTRAVADDALNDVLRAVEEKQLPVHFMLNGGIWADATCDDPEWDVNDHLEKHHGNAQWTQRDKVPPDDALKNLAGSTPSPELARSLTLNVYAREVRRYKKRNLQAAARRIAQFAHKQPRLFVGINLDADTYMNPFFEEREWFDYNPDTLRQFRDWLRGSGPYAGRGESGIPDLRAFRRARPLTLAQVRALAKADWVRWSEVQPPRQFPGSKGQPAGPGQPTIFDDPWYREWDTFRKHLVALHYSEPARWTHEAGIPKERIFTAQGFATPEGEETPFAVRVTSVGQNYDSGGVSVEGAIPSHGHLGAMLYGKAAENRVRMEHRHGLFATFARMDPGWAVVETNMADLRRPDVLPTYGQSYRAYRELFNYDARQVSLMAWNGSNGIFAGQPGYVSYTSFRNTPAEQAMRDHLVSHAGLPLGSRLWTFGSTHHADDDGWLVVGGAIEPERGRVVVKPTQLHLALVSPADQVIRDRNAAALVIGVDPALLREIGVWAEAAPGTGWVQLTDNRQVARLTKHDAGIEVPLRWPAEWRNGSIVERIRIDLVAGSDAALSIEHVALLPGRRARSTRPVQ